MTLFVILQLIFDAFLVAGLLFGFHWMYQRVQRRREDDEVMRNVELQELHAGLQELLVTVRQVGGEVTGRLHDKVQAAEATLERLEAVLKDLRPELEGLQALSREVDSEREHLEAKRASLKSARETAPAPPVAEAPGTVEAEEEEETLFDVLSPMEEDDEEGETRGLEEALIPSTAVGFSSTAVKEIYRLADTHLDVGEIARQTHLTKGEVQLILNLRSNRFTTPN